IIVAVMMSTACSDPEIEPAGGTSSNQFPTRQFHTAVTTWSQPDGSYFVGLVSNAPSLDLSKSKISVVENGKRIAVDSDFNISRLSWLHSRNEGYFWATTKNNILLLNYAGSTSTSRPPFPLEVIIVY
ncbi:MAG TPA: hypothetical protein VK589_16015, partial [Chryseolinea sp.]|nr:hypothetical protein [Chryseolinea sp.]